MWDRIANSLANCWQIVLLPVCELWAIAEFTERTHSHLGIGKRKKTERTKGREDYGKTEFGQDAVISVEEAIFVQSYKSRARDLDLEHTLDARSPGCHRVQVYSQSSHLPTRRSDFRESQKCPYHVTFDLDLDLEHIFCSFLLLLCKTVRRAFYFAT